MTSTTTARPQLLKNVLSRLRIQPLDRYLIRHFLVCYVICSTILMGLFIVLEGLSHLDNFMKQDESLLFVMFQYFLWMAPQYYCQMLGPILTLMAALFAVTLLNKGNEIVPMRSAGMSLQRILAPFFVMALLAGAGMIFVQELVLPNFRTEIRKAHSFGERSENIRNVKREDISGQLIEVPIYVPTDRVGRSATHMPVRIRRMWPNNKIHQLIHSREITWMQETESAEEHGYWRLSGEVHIQTWDQNGVEQAPEERDTYNLITEVKPTDLELTSKEERSYMSTAELARQYKRNSEQRHLEVKIHRRFAFPLANAILLLLGFPFVFRGLHQSVFVGIGTAIAISAAYLLADTVCADLGNDGILPPILAAWLPVLFFGALGYTLFDGIEN
ncbi:MAG: LptF/LptG family permease [Planctomycetota bacterium]